MIKLLTKKQKAAKRLASFNRNRIAENAAQYQRKPVFIHARAAKKAAQVTFEAKSIDFGSLI